jgi:hypothetical protein
MLPLATLEAEREGERVRQVIGRSWREALGERLRALFYWRAFQQWRKQPPRDCVAERRVLAGDDVDSDVAAKTAI